MERYDERFGGEDDIDGGIIGALRRNARASYADIGRAVGLSPNAVAVRVKRLEARRAIEGYAVLLPEESPSVEALVEIRLSTDVSHTAVERELVDVPGTIEILDLSGRADYMVRIGAQTMSELHASVQRIRRIPGVTASDTRSVLRVVLRQRLPDPGARTRPER